jgi:ABC-2 type transport system ATP-binding protein
MIDKSVQGRNMTGTSPTTTQAATEADAALYIRGLHKSYGAKRALAGVSFSLAQGERLAFLGPNGAGKTTLIRCLSGRTKPDQGEIWLMGKPVTHRDSRDVLGLVPQEIALYQDLTTRENLTIFGKFHGLSRSRLRDRVEWALDWTGLLQRADDFVGSFSGGMKRRVNLACGVMHSPQVLLLDEPTVGVDPQSRERIFCMLDDLSHAGCSIVLTTHHLDEAEQQCDRVVIVDHGKVVAGGTVNELIDRSVGSSRWVKLRVDPPLREDLLVDVDDPTSSLGQTGDKVLSARIDDVSAHLPGLIEWVRDEGYAIADIEVQAPSLHHVFLHLTGHQLRD